MAVITPPQLPEPFVKVVQQGTNMRTQALQYLNTAVQDQADALKVEQSRVIALYGANSHQAIVTNERVLEHSALV